MKDRIPLLPGRITLTPVPGQANTYDMVRADQPQEVGTPINKNTLLSDAAEIKLWGNAANRTVSDAFIRVWPKGFIVLWSGATSNIPAGWHLCDGTNGTPDLRNRFVLGAGNSYAVGATGGEITHTLTDEEMPRHNHLMPGYQPDGDFGMKSGLTGANYSIKGYPLSYSGGNQPHNNMPPYYALCYIMKL